MKNQLDFFQKATLLSIAIVGFIFILIDYAQFSPSSILPERYNNEKVDYKIFEYLKYNTLNALIYIATFAGTITLIFKHSKIAWLISSLAFSTLVVKQYYSFILYISVTDFDDTEFKTLQLLSFGLVVVIVFIMTLLLNFLLSKKIRSMYF